MFLRSFAAFAFPSGRRIRDDQARDVATQFSDALIMSTMARLQSEAQAHMDETTGFLITFSERIGVLLRELEIEQIKDIALVSR